MDGLKSMNQPPGRVSTPPPGFAGAIRPLCLHWQHHRHCRCCYCSTAHKALDSTSEPAALGKGARRRRQPPGARAGAIGRSGRKVEAAGCCAIVAAACDGDGGGGWVDGWIHTTAAGQTIETPDIQSNAFGHDTHRDGRRGMVGSNRPTSWTGGLVVTAAARAWARPRLPSLSDAGGDGRLRL